MSKSLKNFVKIKDALERYGPVQLRLLFLLHQYNAPMSYSESGMEEMVGVERFYAEFFGTVKSKLRAAAPDASQKWGDREKVLATALVKAKDEVRLLP